MTRSVDRAQSQSWRAGSVEEGTDGPTFADACCIAAIFVVLMGAATLGLAATYLLVVHL